MGAGDEPLGIELDLRAGSARVLGVRARRLALSLTFELFLCLPQRGAPALARPKPLRQLIAARLAVELVLAAVDLRRLGQDLARDLLVAEVGRARGVRSDLRAVDRHHPDRHQPGPPAQPQHAREQLGQRVLVAHPKLRDRRVVGDQVGADHAVGHVLDAGALDPAR
jgi:hypothetical protein